MDDLETYVDKFSLKKFKNLHPDFALRVYKLFKQYNTEHEYRLRITEGVRSFERQAELYQIGRTSMGKIVTNAQHGFTMHHWGIACDIAFYSSDLYLRHLSNQEYNFYWNEFGRIAKLNGLQWGGEFQIKDMPHVQFDYGIDKLQYRSLYDNGGIVAIWDKIDTILQVNKRDKWTSENGKFLFKPIDPKTMGEI